MWRLTLAAVVVLLLVPSSSAAAAQEPSVALTVERTDASWTVSIASSARSGALRSTAPGRPSAALAYAGSSVCQDLRNALRSAREYLDYLKDALKSASRGRNRLRRRIERQEKTVGKARSRHDKRCRR